MKYQHLGGRTLLEELQNLQRYTEQPTFPGFNLEPTVFAAAPNNPTAGDFLYVQVAGGSWNPGAGTGLYRRTIAGAWVQVFAG